MGRRPPLTPDAFGEEMRMRAESAAAKKVNLFTNGKDQPFLIDKYNKAFNEMVASNHVLGCPYAGWGLPELCRVLEVFPHCTALTDLVLSGSDLGDAGAANISAALKATGRVPYNLDLFETGMTDVGLASLVEVLKNLRPGRMDFSGNAIGDAGAKALAEEVLTSNSSIIELWIEDCNISDAGAASLRQALSVNTSMKTLSLQWNRFSVAEQSLLQIAWGDRPSQPWGGCNL